MFIVILFLLLSLIVLQIVYKNNLFVDSKIKQANYEKYIKYFEFYDRDLSEIYDSLYKKIKLFPFDPNTATNVELKKLGLNKKQVKIIRNFLDKGSVFYSKEYFGKMYSIHPIQYKYLEPYINIKKKKRKYSSNYYQFNYNNNNNKNYNNQKDQQENKIIKLFPFDPNTATKEELELIGFNEKNIAVILKFRKKKWTFYNKESVKKIYGLSNEFYNKIESYISIKTENKEQKKIIIEINTAKKEKLKQISGIGEYYANGIVKYRKMLGGFAFKEQLLEVYGVKNELYEKIKEQVEIDKSKIIRININESTAYRISKHPYISNYQAKAIKKYNKLIGNVEDIKTLVKNNIFTQKESEKIQYYINF